MTDIKQIVDNLILSVKQELQDNSIRFIKAYNNKTAEKPVSGLLAVVGIESINKTGGFVDFSELSIRLMGGQSITDEELCSAALMLAEALESVDEYGYIESISVTKPSYDKNTTALYRDIKLAVSAFSENNYADIYINSESIGGVKGIKVEEKTTAIKLCEFHNSVPYAVLNDKTDYEITLELADRFTEPEGAFTLTFGSESYADCIVSQKSVAINKKGQIVYTVRIKSNRKVTA